MAKSRTNRTAADHHQLFALRTNAFNDRPPRPPAMMYYGKDGSSGGGISELDTIANVIGLKGVGTSSLRTFVEMWYHIFLDRKSVV